MVCLALSYTLTLLACGSAIRQISDYVRPFCDKVKNKKEPCLPFEKDMCPTECAQIEIIDGDCLEGAIPLRGEYESSRRGWVPLRYGDFAMMSKAFSKQKARYGNKWQSRPVKVLGRREYYALRFVSPSEAIWEDVNSGVKATVRFFCGDSAEAHQRGDTLDLQQQLLPASWQQQRGQPSSPQLITTINSTYDLPTISGGLPFGSQLGSPRQPNSPRHVPLGSHDAHALAHDPALAHAHAGSPLQTSVPNSFQLRSQLPLSPSHGIDQAHTRAHGGSPIEASVPNSFQSGSQLPLSPSHGIDQAHTRAHGGSPIEASVPNSFQSGSQLPLSPSHGSDPLSSPKMHFQQFQSSQPSSVARELSGHNRGQFNSRTLGWIDTCDSLRLGSSVRKWCGICIKEGKLPKSIMSADRVELCRPSS